MQSLLIAKEPNTASSSVGFRSSPQFQKRINDKDMHIKADSCTSPGISYSMHLVFQVRPPLPHACNMCWIITTQFFSSKLKVYIYFMHNYRATALHGFTRGNIRAEQSIKLHPLSCTHAIHTRCQSHSFSHSKRDSPVIVRAK